jgi:hypothetical protein
MDLTGKTMKCSAGPAKRGEKAHAHNFPAELCIMVVLRRLSSPCSFHELVDIFGFPDNRLAEMFHTGVEYLYFKYKKLVSLESWVPYFPAFADLNHEYGSPYRSNVAMVDRTLTEFCRPGGLRNVSEQNRLDQHNFFNGNKGVH